MQVIKHPDPGAAARHRGAKQIKFNPKQRDFIAVAYLDGFCRIYQLSYRLANIQRNELKLLTQLLDEKEQ